MNRSLLWSLGLLTLLVITGSIATGRADGVAIVHSSNPTAALSKTEIENILQGRSSSWPSGGRLTLVVPKESAGAEAMFKNWANFTTDQFLNHWKRLVFVGKGKMPKIVPDDDAAIKDVASDPTSLSFVSSTATLVGVKKIDVK